MGPSLNGTTTGFEPHTFDLSAHGGQTILLGFRYVSEGGVNEGGLLVDDIAVGGSSVSDGSSPAPFRAPTQVRPHQVENWNLKLVGIREGMVPQVLQVELDGRNQLSLDRDVLRAVARFDTLVAIVATDDSSELVQQFAPYTLESTAWSSRAVGAECVLPRQRDVTSDRGPAPGRPALSGRSGTGLPRSTPSPHPRRPRAAPVPRTPHAGASRPPTRPGREAWPCAR